MNISLTKTQWNTVWTLVKSCIDSTDDPKSAAHYGRILRRLENPKESAHIKELEAQLAAAESALKKIRSINDKNGVIMTGSARDAIQDVTEQYFAQVK